MEEFNFRQEILQVIEGDIIEFETTPPERHY